MRVGPSKHVGLLGLFTGVVVASLACGGGLGAPGIDATAIDDGHPLVPMAVTMWWPEGVDSRMHIPTTAPWLAADGDPNTAFQHDVVMPVLELVGPSTVQSITVLAGGSGEVIVTTVHPITHKDVRRTFRVTPDAPVREDLGFEGAKFVSIFAPGVPLREITLHGTGPKPVAPGRRWGGFDFDGGSHSEEARTDKAEPAKIIVTDDALRIERASGTTVIPKQEITPCQWIVGGYPYHAYECVPEGAGGRPTP